MNIVWLNFSHLCFFPIQHTLKNVLNGFYTASNSFTSFKTVLHHSTVFFFLYILWFIEERCKIFLQEYEHFNYEVQLLSTKDWIRYMMNCMCMCTHILAYVYMF